MNFTHEGLISVAFGKKRKVHSSQVQDIVNAIVAIVLNLIKNLYLDHYNGRWFIHAVWIFKSEPYPRRVWHPTTIM